MTDSVVVKLAEVQRLLKAPKGQFNGFGKYKYRNCEDILEAVKPLLDGAVLTLSDDIIEICGRVYVKATATLHFGNTVEVTAYAREAVSKKGMDEAQITGAASSYARKYALNGLFCIDDTKDSDSHDNTNHNQQTVNVVANPLADHRKRIGSKLQNNFSGDVNAIMGWLKSNGFKSVKLANEEELNAIEKRMAA